MALAEQIDIITEFTQRLQVAVIGAEETTDKHEKWVEGTETETIPTANGPLKTLRGQIAEWRLSSDSSVQQVIDSYSLTFEQKMDQFDDDFVNYLLTIGFEPAVIYGSGILIERRAQTVAFNGVTYYWGGTLPYTTTGDFGTEPSWLIAPIIGGVEIPQMSFASGGNIVRKTQSVLGADGGWYYWTGTFPKLIAPGSTVESAGGVGQNKFKLSSGVVPLRPLMKIVASSAGLVLNPGSFEYGATISSETDALPHFGTGKLWRWGGVLPKVVDVGSEPSSSGGVGPSQWIEVSTAGSTNAGITISEIPPTGVALGHRWYCTSDGRTYIRYLDSDSVQWVEESPQGSVFEGLEPRINESLRRSYAEAGYNVVGTFLEGFTYVNANDVGIDEVAGKGFTGPAGPVAAGTDPTSGGFVDVSDKIRMMTNPLNIQAFLDKFTAGDVTIPPGVYTLWGPLTIEERNSNSASPLQRYKINATGVVLRHASGELTHNLLNILSCKRFKIEGLRVEGVVNIAGLWDSQLVDCDFEETVFGDDTLGTGFVSHYWNTFQRTRLGKVTMITSGTRVANHEFNDNSFNNSIVTGFTLRGTGSLQSMSFFGGEFRGNFVVESNQYRDGQVPNSIDFYGTYFDQAGNYPDLKGLQVNTHGNCSAVNAFSFDGQRASDGGTGTDQSMYGFRPEIRTATSVENLAVGGQANSYPVYGPIRNIHLATNVSATQLQGFIRIGATGPFSLFVYKTEPVALAGWYSFTAIFRKPTSGAMQVRVKNRTSGGSYNDCMSNKSLITGDFIVGSFSVKAAAGDVLAVEFYGPAVAAGEYIDVSSVFIGLGKKANLGGYSQAGKGFREFTLSGKPASGTYILNDRINISPATPGAVAQYICTTDGTIGAVATTGSINAGSDTLTVSDASGIYEGAWLSIAGVSGGKVVKSVSGNVVALTTTANATVSVASVTFRAPVLKPSSQVGPSPSITSAPVEVGLFATVSGVGYMSVGTSSAADWKQIT